MGQWFERSSGTANDFKKEVAVELIRGRIVTLSGGLSPKHPIGNSSRPELN
jgi:hypothetical protein